MNWGVVQESRDSEQKWDNLLGAWKQHEDLVAREAALRAAD